MHLFQCKLFKSAGQDKGLLKELANDKFRLCKIYVSVTRLRRAGNRFTLCNIAQHECRA